MARIAIDARPLAMVHRTGVENIGAQFTQVLLRAPTLHDWHFYFTAPPSRPLPPSIRWRCYRGRAWLRLIVPLWLTLDRIDLVHFYLSYVPPLARWVRALSVVTVYDVMWLNLSLIDPPSRRFIVKGVLPSLRKRTDHFIAISEATKRDLVQKLGIAPERISIVRPYVDARWRPCSEAAEAVRRLYGIEGDFLLFVGTAKPNKNVGRLLDAFARVRSRHPNAQLVVVGFVLPFWEETQRIMKGEPGVRWLQYVPEEHLPLLYSACAAFVSPSLDEGFGLPLLEAMACGAPVIAGTTGAQPEVVGTAGLLVDPFCTEAIAEAIEVLWTERTVREGLRHQGLERARLFTPERTLQQLLGAYATALQGGKR